MLLSTVPSLSLICVCVICSFLTVCYCMLISVLCVKYRGTKEAAAMAAVMSPSGQGVSHTNAKLKAPHYIWCVCVWPVLINQNTNTQIPLTNTFLPPLCSLWTLWVTMPPRPNMSRSFLPSTTIPRTKTARKWCVFLRPPSCVIQVFLFFCTVGHP